MFQRVLECTCALSPAFHRALQTVGRETQNAGVSWVPLYSCGQMGGDSRVASNEFGSNLPSTGVSED